MKIVRWFFLVCLIAGIAVSALLPFATPPIAESLARDALSKLGFPSDVRFDVGYEWTPRGPGIRGTASVTPQEADWTLAADFGASFREWHARIRLPPTTFCESEPVVRQLLTRYLPTNLSNLIFTCSASLDASVSRTPDLPVPVWSAKVTLDDADIDLCYGDRTVSVRQLSFAPAVSGIARHVDYAPLRIRARSFQVKDFAFTNYFASVMFDGTRLLVSEARAGFCGGEAAAYAFSLDTKSLNAGFNLFVDNLDAGRVLSHVHGFNGTASGLLHGKIRLYARDGGRQLFIRDAYLYSTPGETGKLKIDDAESLTDALSMSGLGESDRQNIAKALTDVDYAALKLDLRRNGKDDDSALTIKLDGSATRGDVTVPVVINLRLRGDFNQLINTGLKLTRGRKAHNP